MVGAEPRVEHVGFLGNTCLVLGEDLGDRCVVHLEGLEAPHDLLIGHCLDLLLLGFEGGDPDAAVIHLALDVLEDCLLGLARILNALGIEVVDLPFDSDLRH